MSNASEASSLTQQNPQQQRLSCMSCSTKNAMVLNQLQHVEIPTSYARIEDGVRVYVLEVALKSYQTGIPNVRMSAEFIGEHIPNRDTWASMGMTTSRQSIAPQPPPLSTQTESSNVTERNSNVNSSNRANKSKNTHTSAKPSPQYQIEYRYSAFRELRARLLEAVEENDRHHRKWCWYCSRIQWVVSFGPFSSRHPLLHSLAKRSRCGGSLERVLLDKFWRRRHQLEMFVNEVVASAKDASYRYQSTQCECFARVAGIVANFLAEPSSRCDG